jgi:replicative DNA helicase
MTVTTEEKLLSALCSNKDMHVVMGLDAQLFGAYKDVFDYMRDYYARYRAVPDRKELTERFEKVELPDVNGPTPHYLHELQNEYVSAKMRNVLALADAALDAGESGPEALEKLTQKLVALGKFSASAKDVDLMDSSGALEHYRKVRENSELNGGPGIPTGFKSIDAVYTTGFAPGQSITIMGYTGQMKTFFALLMATNMIAAGKKVLFISLEMTPEEVGDRVYALLGKGKFRISDLQRGDVNEDDFRTWASATLKSNLIVPSFDGVYDVTPNFIRGKIERYGVDICFIDYLQLMSDNSGTSHMVDKMRNLSREIKLMAGACKICIVSLTAVTDEEGGKREGPPNLGKIAWSRAAEYDSNLIMAVHKYAVAPNGGPVIIEVVARKSRHSDLFDFGFEVDADRGIWTERFDLFDG